MREYKKAIAFGEETVVLLELAEDNGIADLYTHIQIHEELEFAYSNLAWDPSSARRFGKDSSYPRTGRLFRQTEHDWHVYVRELEKIPEEVAFPRMLSFLEFLQKITDDDVSNHLTVYLHGGSEYDDSHSALAIVLQAAHKSGKLEWLASVYQDAVREAQKKNHMLVLQMNSELKSTSTTCTTIPGPNYWSRKSLTSL